MQSRQRPHQTLKNNQRHGIRRKRPQEARQKASPVPLPSSLPIHVHGSLPPPVVLSCAVPQPAAQRIRHYALLDEVDGVAGEPKDLRREPARPKVDGRVAEGRVLVHEAREEVVRGPPEEEEAAEEERGGEAVVDAADAVVAVDLAHAVNGARVEALGLGGGVLDLEARLDVLDGRGDEGDGRAGEDAREAVAKRGKGRLW